eukprot:Rmarinus@m.29997
MRESLLGNPDVPSSPDLSPATIEADGDDGCDNILAVFIVHFDIKKGNVVEWIYPEDFDYGVLEFKAMASGFHRVDNDFVVFKLGSKFGLASFNNRSTDDASERNARMRSVGVIMPTHHGLRKYYPFLSVEAMWSNEVPEDRSRLIDLYHSHETREKLRAMPSPHKLKNEVGVRHRRYTVSLPTPLEIINEAGSFATFLKYFGSSVFQLWKAVLLRKRILLYSPTPIGVLCDRARCVTSLLSLQTSGGVTVQHRNSSNKEIIRTPGDPHIPPSAVVYQPNALYYVNVTDIDDLHNLSEFVACTSEKIFVEKKDLYDVYVDCTTVKPSEVTRHVTKLTPLDESRWRCLYEDHALTLDAAAFKGSQTKFKNQRTMKVVGDSPLVSYFGSLNKRLFSSLRSSAETKKPVLRQDLAKLLGLDPSDYAFVRELCEVYQIPAVFSNTCPCV